MTSMEATLLALFLGQRLCINFFVSRANFQTTLCSHLDATCSRYFWFSLEMNVVASWIKIEKIQDKLDHMYNNKIVMD